MSKALYKVIWDNEHACDSLGEYETYEEALSAGQNWFWTMVYLDGPEQVGENKECYSFEIFDPEGDECDVTYGGGLD